MPLSQGVFTWTRFSKTLTFPLLLHIFSLLFNLSNPLITPSRLPYTLNLHFVILTKKVHNVTVVS